MKLRTLTIGKVAGYDMDGQEVPSGIIGGPVPEPWIIDEGGPIGNEKAIHTDAVYAFSRTHYNCLGEFVQRDPAVWPDGYLGENLTFDEMREDNLRIGDIYALGDEVQLVVAGPRVPCWKLSWRLGVSKSFLSEFAISGHTGVYFGVVRPGRIRPDDEMRLVRGDPAMPTVPQVAKYCAGKGDADLDGMRRALDNRALSLTVRIVLQARASHAERARSRAWPGWREFEVAEVFEETSQVRSYRLAPVGAPELPAARPGQFVSVRLPDGSVRPWSLSEYAPGANSYRITVKRTGTGSSLLHSDVHVGTRLQLRAPAGAFTLDDGSFRPPVFVAAGIGITPLFAMMQAHLQRGPEAPPAYLIYGAQDRSAQALRRELDPLVSDRSNISVVDVYSQPSSVDSPHACDHIAGRITLEVVRDVLKDNYIGDPSAPIPLPWYEADFYICGPGEMTTVLTGDLARAGVNPDRIFSERFVPLIAASDSTVETATVLFGASGKTMEWNAIDDMSLLELAEEGGVEVPNDCRAGACHTCQSKILDGATTAAHLMPDGSPGALLCIGRPSSRTVTINA